jgi:prepilin-type N-terminal cleavage/methylation domain-containing protein
MAAGFIYSDSMSHRIRTARAGFTLVEIMIVTAIIALLAAIAIPGFLRSRKRSAATAIINDARVIDTAMDQYALENNQKGSATVTAAQLQGFFKPDSRLYADAGNGSLTDLLGNPYTFSTFDGGVKVNSGTTANFADVIDNPTSFWGAYY